jgi:NAD(P)-dependent dehydrogenase (short-subunit alcohol dehydrogenase family)
VHPGPIRPDALSFRSLLSPFLHRTGARFGGNAADPAEGGVRANPREVARLALYLASHDADYVTGQSFVIDGGLEMNWGQGA